MPEISAIVNDSTHLTLESPIALPPGAHVRVFIDLSRPNDYASRVANYYASATPEALEEERALANVLDAAGASMPDEQPWW